MTRTQRFLIVAAFITVPLIFAVCYVAVDDYGRAKFDIPRRLSALPIPKSRDDVAQRKALEKRVIAFDGWLPRQLMNGIGLCCLAALGIGLPVFNVILAIRSASGPIVAVLRGARWFFGGLFICVFCALPTSIGLSIIASRPVGAFAKALGFSP